jgi:hypothetical protein
MYGEGGIEFQLDPQETLGLGSYDLNAARRILIGNLAIDALTKVPVSRATKKIAKSFRMNRHMRARDIRNFLREHDLNNSCWLGTPSQETREMLSLNPSIEAILASSDSPHFCRTYIIQIAEK